MINHLKSNNIQSFFHYIPLHHSEECKKYFSFYGDDKYTTKESDRLLRLPLYFDLEVSEVKYICEKVREFFYK